MFIHKEGYLWAGIPALFSLSSIFFKNKKLAGLGLVLACFNAYFFRNPQRQVPLYNDILVSPADGKVIKCDIEEKPEWYPEPLYRIGIFMRIWDVHINRSPVSGKILRMEYVKGEKRPVFDNFAFQKNEKQIYLIEREDGLPIWLIQIAGKIARRIKNFVNVGEDLIIGDPIGIIKFSSRVEMFFPVRDAKIFVKKGHRVFAGETVIAQIPLKKK